MPRQDTHGRASLVLSVRFLHGRYHGAEWPPSPRRLFLALVYALYTGRGRPVGIHEGEKALLSLERMNPPEIYAPHMERGCKYTIFVPNNDGDIAKRPEKLKTRKVLAPYVADGPVVYSWEIVADDQANAEVLCRLAKGIPSLGLGIDPVAANGQMADKPTMHDGLLRYVPDEQGESFVQVPTAGLLANAKKRHQMFCARLEGGRYTKPAEITCWRDQAYRTNATERTVAGFWIKRIMPDGKLPLRGEIIPDGMAPHLIREAGRMKAKFMGERAADRVKTMLLPSIGSKYADVRVRRIAFLAPPGTRAQVRSLEHKTLNVEGNTYQLEALGRDDPVLNVYKRPSRFFASVTPVKFGGSKRRQAPSVLAGMLKNETGGTTTFVNIKDQPHWGTKNATERDGVFAELEFESKVSGPFMVGDGQERGCGLLAPMTVSDVAYFRILGRGLPVLMTLAVGNAMRKAALSKAMRRHKQAPAAISGHESDGRPLRRNHDHAFWLPYDANRDGFIDHIAVYVNGGFDHLTRETLGRIAKISDGASVDLSVRLVGFFVKKDMNRCTLFDNGTKWTSGTPYFMPWHVKKNFGLEDQLKKECKIRGYGPASIAHHEIVVGGRRMPATLFVNSHAGRKPINKTGEAVALKFNKNVRGPIALGFGCHFGLGMFVPEA